ncbi:tRNA lysidine(34) synthetase TilS [Deinococcus sp. Leaf326]|uniref:tRNA lysidine(34) synthetase TilS n=1 Tax=Deinococcus sp. Leaf326 TaxID=1736338 RepID=UPI000B2311DA|nr:tRNA lysidine(34) synthetase TilS [Deinococcus sp. Leaf326]
MNALPAPTVPDLLLGPLRPYAGERVAVGVSGGADSVALLRALLLVGALPVAAHLDHALREDSAQDAAWVAELAAGLDVPFGTARVDVAAVARRRGANVEEAARRVRYDFLARTARAHGAGVVLTAHTRRDQAETVLWGLLRGEATARGILPVWGRVRRPWLEVPRDDLEAFLRGLGQAWREDPTNADPAYTRAWLRREVMPVLRARVPALEEALARFARLNAEDDAALSAQAAALTLHAPLRHQPLAVLRRHVAAELRAAGLAYHAPHVETLAGSLHSGTTRHLTLPGAHPVTATGGRLHLGPLTWPEPDFTLPSGWTRRTRQPGDRLRLPGGTRKLSDVLTDARVPREERGRVPLVVDAGGAVQWAGLNPPLWAVGAREQVGAMPATLHAAMGEALALAHEAAGAGEVPVGAVVLDATGQVVGRGRNTSREHGDMTRHAELAALREAGATVGPYLGNCTLVVTLEPCPMCLGAAIEARVGHVVYGAVNPKAGALGGVSDLLAAHWGHAPRVTSGVRAAEAGALLRRSFQAIRERERGGAEE